MKDVFLKYLGDRVKRYRTERGDPSGGGLIRSAGGWEGARALKKERIFQKSDERILGDGEFVERVLRAAEEGMEKWF